MSVTQFERAQVVQIRNRDTSVLPMLSLLMLVRPQAWHLDIELNSEKSTVSRETFRLTSGFVLELLAAGVP